MTDNLVTILGYTDLAGRLPAQTSQLYGTNVVNLFKLLTPGKDGQLVLDHEDVVQRGITVTQDGESLWPPPPVQVSAAPAAPAPVTRPEPVDRRRRSTRGARSSRPLSVLSCSRSPRPTHPASFLSHFTVFALAIFVGYYVISNVAHALHTPLMSETNAISGIILVGAHPPGRQRQPRRSRCSPLVAVLVASINIFGGFLVTARGCSRCSGRTDTSDFLTSDRLPGLIQAAYILAAILFILALAGLSKHETARRGNTFGMAGMGLALVATLVLAARNSQYGDQRPASPRRWSSSSWRWPSVRPSVRGGPGRSR